MPLSSLKLGVSGARGVVGDSLTPEVVVRLGAAFAAGREGETVLVGSDTRPTGPLVRHALFAGLAGAGCSVADAGICATPSILNAIRNRMGEFGGGVIVTASHNPIEWNALKFVSRDGFFLSPAEGEALVRIFRGEASPPYAAYDRIGSIEAGPDVTAEHLDAVLRLPYLAADQVAEKRWKVVLDGVGGAGIPLATVLLERLGCEVIALHCTMDGSFPRPPEPKPENLGDLCDTVRTTGADAGFALDPDGDRLSLVTGDGRALSEERTVALVADYVLSREPGPVVVNLSTSRAIEDLAARYGVPFYRTPVGEAHVAAEMVKRGAAVGGEGNGGVMVPAIHPMRDAATGIALILQAMTDGGTMEELDRRIPEYVLRKEVFPAEAWDEDRLIGEMTGRFGDAEVDRRDGVRLAWANRWIQVRPSNTEPVVRVYAEAPESEEAAALQEVAGAIVTDRGIPDSGALSEDPTEAR